MWAKFHVFILILMTYIFLSYTVANVFYVFILSYFIEGVFHMYKNAKIQL